MIELKGIYYNDGKHSPMAVLVQFDGQILYVWHLTDPFFRLRSSSQFVVKQIKKKAEKIIKFPDGAFIESENAEALDILMQKSNRTRTSKGQTICSKSTMIFIALLILLLIGAGWSIFI